jgi:hypothetical protein
MRADSQIIGNERVEIGAKQYKEQFAEVRTRWSWKGAEGLPPFCSAIMGKCFDDVWSAA